MADINEILGKEINSVKELKKAISDLQNSLIGVDTESEEFKTTSQQLAAAQAELVKVTRAGKEENVAAKDSIVGLKQEYKALYDQYKMLTEEQRNSDFGKQMAESLNTLSTKINETQKGVGAFKDNVGRYAEGVTDAFKQMGISLGSLQKPLQVATTGTKTFGTALKGLAANPVGAAILAIVAALKVLHDIFDRVKQAIADNEELTNRLHEAMAVFQPVLDAISNAFDFLARILVRVIEGISKVASGIMSVIPGMKKAIDSHKELAKATNDLTLAQRELSVENSKKQADIERLREEASATEDVNEKVRLLQEAKRKQQEIDEDNIRIAKEELRIMQEYSEKTANSAEENERLAEAQKKVNDAIAQGERNARQYNRQLSSLSKNIDIDINVSIREQLESTQEKIETTREKLSEYYTSLENQRQELVNLYNQIKTGPVDPDAGLWENVKNVLTAQTKDLTEQLKNVNKGVAIADEIDAKTEEYEAMAKEYLALQKEYNDLLMKQEEENKRNREKTGKDDLARAENLVKQLKDYGEDEIEVLTQKYNEEVALLTRFHMSTTKLTEKYLDDVAKITEDRYKKQREDALKLLQQEYQDREAFIELIERDNERLANSLRLDNLEENTIPALQAFYNKVSGMSAEVIQLIGEKGFAGLGDEYKELKEEVEDLNASLGTNITNFDILEATLNSTKIQAKELVGTIAQQGIDEILEKANEGFLNLNLQKISENLGKGVDAGFFKSIGDEIKEVWDTVFNGKTDEYSILVAENAYDALQKEKEVLAEEITNFKGTQDQKVELLRRYYEVVEEIYDKELELTTLQQERTAQMIESMIDLTDRMSSSMNTYRSTMESLIDSEVKAGKISEKEAKEKKERLLNLEKWEQRFAIATIAADAAAGIFSVWKGYAQEKGTINPQTAAAAGPGAAVALAALNTKSLVSAIAQTASLATTAAAQIAAARGKYVTDSNNFHADAGGGTSVSSVPTLISSEPYTYTQTIQNVDTEDELNKRPIIVRVEDIIDGVEGHNVRVSESSW